MATKAEREAWLMKLAISVTAGVVVAFILGGVGLSVVVGGIQSDVEASQERDDRLDERVNRVEERSIESYRNVEVKLTEIRGLLHDMRNKK